MYEHIHLILDAANSLLKSGHFASEDIDRLSHQLNQEWQGFALAMDERSNLLAMSVMFHEKAEIVGHHFHAITSALSINVVLGGQGHNPVVCRLCYIKD